MTIITDSADPRLNPYRVMTLRNPGEHSGEGTFIADSDKVVVALLRSGAGVRSIFALPEFYEQYAGLIAERNLPDAAQLTASPAIMEQVTGFRHHSGVMAVGVQPPLASLDDMTFPAVALCGAPLQVPPNAKALRSSVAGARP